MQKQNDLLQRQMMDVMRDMKQSSNDGKRKHEDDADSKKSGVSFSPDTKMIALPSNNHDSNNVAGGSIIRAGNDGRNYNPNNAHAGGRYGNRRPGRGYNKGYYPPNNYYGNQNQSRYRYERPNPNNALARGGLNRNDSDSTSKGDSSVGSNRSDKSQPRQHVEGKKKNNDNGNSQSYASVTSNTMVKDDTAPVERMNIVPSNGGDKKTGNIPAVSESNEKGGNNKKDAENSASVKTNNLKSN